VSRLWRKESTERERLLGLLLGRLAGMQSRTHEGCASELPQLRRGDIHLPSGWRSGREIGQHCGVERRCAQSAVPRPDEAGGRVPEVTISHTNEHGKWPCACCGFHTMDLPAGDTYMICPVCGWEDDQVQFADLDHWGGANHVSLSQDGRNFEQCGRADPAETFAVRHPVPDEQPRFDWTAHVGRGKRA
jgi:hypothetical protein